MKYLAACLTILELVSAHGYFEAPLGRKPGNAFSAACGAQANSMMSSDINGNIQGLQNLVASQSDYDPTKCDFWTCKVCC